jgi:hypothetical protein
MVANNFGTRNFMQPMGMLSMHSKCLDLFSFRFWIEAGVGGRGIFFLCSQYVPKVSNVFLMAVPNSTSL